MTSTLSQASQAAPSVPGAGKANGWRHRLPAGFADLAGRAACRIETAPAGTLVRLLFVVSFLFMAVPQLDLAVARWFADGAAGFPLQRHPALLLLRQVHHAATIALLAAGLASLVVAATGLRSRWVMRPHKALFLLAVYAAGPGLLVNLVLKNLFGRARPRELTQFGGALDFTTPWQFVGGCVGNCSFTSGEAASAAALLTVAMVVPRARRLGTFLALSVPVLLFSVNRIAFGGHFLSDVVLSWFAVAIVALLLRRPLFRVASDIDATVTGAAVPLLGAAASWLARQRLRGTRTGQRGEPLRP